MLDLLVRDGTVVTPAGAAVLDVGVKDGRIAVLASPGRSPEAVEVVDARGDLVVPGGVEPHTHLAHRLIHQLPAEVYGLGPEDDTVGLAHGGVTTHIDFCYVPVGASPAKALEERIARWRGNSHVDYSFHIGLTGPQPPEAIAEIPDLVRAGFPSVKVFTSTVQPPTAARPAQIAGFGRIAEIMRRCRDAGGIVTVHAEDDEIVMHNHERMAALGRTGLRELRQVHSALSERVAFRRTIALAESLGAAVHFVHTSSAEGVAAVREARSRGAAVYAETLHGYLCRSAADYLGSRGAMYHTYPALPDAGDQPSLWAGLLDGTLSTVATDELPTTLATKLRGSTIFDVTGGNLGAEARMGIVYSEGVVKRGMSLERFVAVTSANAARIFGLYPRKGTIAPGSDADLAIIDTAVDRSLVAADFHVADYSPWEGWPVKGWPRITILRGKIIARDGVFLGGPAGGLLVARRIDPAVLIRPVC